MPRTPKRSHAKNDPPRAWQRMLSDRRLDLLDPSPLDVELDDISLGLSCVARWNGQTRGEHPFSVAEHSLLVERLAADLKPGLAAKWRLAALLHDAPEYVIGDLISPFKAAVGLDYKSFENRILGAIHLRFGLPPEVPKHVQVLIKRADIASAFLEATQLAGFSQEEAKRLFGKPRFADPSLEKVKIRPVSAKQAEARFTKRARLLLSAMDKGA